MLLALRSLWEIDENAIAALATAIAEIERNPRMDSFAITESLSPICDPPGFVLRNCAVSYRFPAFEHLNALWERIQKAALFGEH